MNWLSWELHGCTFSVLSAKHYDVATWPNQGSALASFECRGHTLLEACKNQTFGMRKNADFCDS